MLFRSDGGPAIEGEEVEIGGPSVNPVRRKQPSELIATGIAGIDLNNTLVSGQKIPFFADPDQPFNQVMANVALRAETDKIILGGMGMTNDDYLYFKNVFSNAGALDRIVSFMNTTENPPVERLLIPDMALTAAEYFAVNNNEKVLVLLTDMTSYADALAIVSNRMDQIPSKDSMPGSLYSDLAKIYEKAVQFPSGGSITIIAVTTLSGGDITHAVPDNTGYITEGQLFLRRDSDIGKVIVDPFRSLSRLKQLVTGKKTRKDHPQVIEIWNLVFMQYNRKADGSLEPLPARVIDTGMGFERLCMALQGKTSNYDTDVFQPIIKVIAGMAGTAYGEDKQQDVAMRVIADHIRTIAFAITDGQLPSNAKAGYVIRRILRRAVRYGYTFLDRKESFMYKLLPVLIETMGDAYPELVAQKTLIERVIKEEEESFLRTLETGIRLLDKKMEETKAAGKNMISGVDAFTLYDTYGFPLDLTELILRENGMEANIDEFNIEMQKQKDRARNAAAIETGDWVVLKEGG